MPRERSSVRWYSQNAAYTGPTDTLPPLISCITTPVVRRKPVRKPKLDATSPSTPARDHSQPTASRSPSLQPVDIPSPDQAYDLDSLPPPLLRSLVDDFIRLPQKHHPCVQAPLANLATSLRRTSYQFSQLSPSTRAFAAGVVALSALISLEPAIVGNGPRPASLESLSLEDDLADLGRRRTPTCNALRASAMKEAKAADSLTETTPENAATCYLLDALDMGALSALAVCCSWLETLLTRCHRFRRHV